MSKIEEQQIKPKEAEIYTPRVKIDTTEKHPIRFDVTINNWEDTSVE
jgi:hypothetical protein